MVKTPLIGVLQGRLTHSTDGSIQFFPKDNWEEEFPAAKSIGFECMELLVKKDSLGGHPLFRLSKILSIMKLSSDLGISTPSIHAFYDRSKYYDEILIKIICAARLLGAKTILISFFNENKLNSESDRATARRQILPLLSYAREAGVRLGIETEMPADELVEFVNWFKSPEVGVYYDIGNMASMGVDVASEIRILGNLICGIHVKDRLPSEGKTVPLGEGCADFKGAFTALKDIGYSGPLIIQGARVNKINDIELNRCYREFCAALVKNIFGEGDNK